MFSYYGSKGKIIDAYPSPKFCKIIEPFAGSARYALKWFDREVLLVDKYDIIIKIWHYLQQASEKDILGLPEPDYKQSLDDFNLAEPELYLVGFWVNVASSTPKKTRQPYANIQREKVNTARQLYKIRHWDIQLGDYKGIPNQDASWFVDPPYQNGGKYYRYNNIDYSCLANWCKNRRGQVIVCENTKADWLQFWPMCQLNGVYSKTVEVIWSNHKTGYEAKQLRLFDDII